MIDRDLNEVTSNWWDIDIKEASIMSHNFQSVVMHTDLHSKWHKAEFKSLPLQVKMHCLDLNKETHVRSTELLFSDLKIMTNTIQTGWVGLTFTTFMNLWNQDLFPWQHLGQGTSENIWSNTAYQQQIKNIKTGVA